MKIAIAGATGFIGRALCNAFDPEENFIIASGHRHMADLAQPEEMFNLVAGCDVVYMCAGITGGAGAIALDPLSFVTPNLALHVALFEACKQAGVPKIVALSSTTGYPACDYPLIEESYFVGDVHPAYFNPGHTRRFIERMGAMYGLNIVWLRPSVVYGPGDNFDLETSHVIPALIRKVSERQNPLTIWGGGTDIRSAVHIDDMVRALMMAKDWPAGAYNIATLDSMSVNQMLGVLLMHAEFEPDIICDRSKPTMIPKRLLSTERAGAMGWSARVPMVTGLTQTYDAYHARQ